MPQTATGQESPDDLLASIVSNNCPVETGVREDPVVLLIAHVVGVFNRLIM